MNLTKLLEDDECEMVGNYLWVTVGNISVRLSRTEEGVVCDMYPLNQENGEALATTYAFFKDAKMEV